MTSIRFVPGTSETVVEKWPAAPARTARPTTRTRAPFGDTMPETLAALASIRAPSAGELSVNLTGAAGRGADRPHAHRSSATVAAAAVRRTPTLTGTP